jgi:hypothetical protein
MEQDSWQQAEIRRQRTEIRGQKRDISVFLISQLSYGLPPFGRVPSFAIRNLLYALFLLTPDYLFLNPQSAIRNLPYAPCSMPLSEATLRA